jgi:hypothetical protein
MPSLGRGDWSVGMTSRVFGLDYTIYTEDIGFILMDVPRCYLLGSLGGNVCTTPLDRCFTGLVSP